MDFITRATMQSHFYFERVIIRVRIQVDFADSSYGASSLVETSLIAKVTMQSRFFMDVRHNEYSFTISRRIT